MIQETKQIINDYPDTLESSIQDAKKVTKQYNQNAQDLERQLQNATK
jgi:ABC-type transporter Mla subunit MlaD